MSSFCHEITFQLLMGALPQTHSAGSLNAFWGERWTVLHVATKVSGVCWCCNCFFLRAWV